MPWDDNVSERFSQVSDLWAEQRSLWLSPNQITSHSALQATTQFVDAIDGFVSAIEQQLSQLTAVLNLFQIVMMALAIAGAVVMLYTGYLYVINPLDNLQQGLRNIESGDFSTRIEVGSMDEFGEVALGFNGMAGKLQTMYDGLEAQVEAKTRRIEAQRSRIETLYEVSAFLASANTIQELSQGFAQRVRKVLNADAVAVRWSDEANQRYLMLASDCFPADMVDEERSLLSGACACGSLKPDARYTGHPYPQP